MGNNLFGDSLKQVTIPTLILIGSEDGIAPSLDHQLLSFTQLAGDKYLLAAIGATHMSATDIRNAESMMVKNTLVREVMDEEAQPLRELIQGLSWAFIQQMTPAASTYQPFLTSAYAQSFSTEAITVRWTSQLPISTKAWLKILSFNPQGSFRGFYTRAVFRLFRLLRVFRLLAMILVQINGNPVTTH